MQLDTAFGWTWPDDVLPAECYSFLVDKEGYDI